MRRPDKIHRAAIDVVVKRISERDRGTMKILADLLDEQFPGAIARASEKRRKALIEAKYRGPVPAYAKKLVAKHWPALGSLTWRRSRYTLRGTCDGFDSITITERIGTSEERMKILVLHEIAHRRGRGHDAVFAAELRRLLVAEGLYRAALKTENVLRGQSKLRRVAARTP